MSDEKSVSLIEQHVGTVLQVLVVGLLAWSLNTTVDLRQDVGILKIQVSSMSALVSSKDGYSAADAAREHGAIWAEMKRLDTRMEKCEHGKH